MTIPPAYSQERWITEAVGNNAFNYQERASSHPEPHLRIAPLEYFDSPTAAFQKLAISRSPAFELYEENQLRSFAGLEKFLLFPAPGSSAPVYVFDNHNHAFFFWHWYAGQQHLPLPLDLIHVDQHKDTRLPATFLSNSEIVNWKELDLYTTEILNVGNFIPPAIKTGLINNPQIVDSSASLQQLANDQLPDHFILDIDLDFFAPELDYLDNQLKLTAIKKALAKASIVTIATSPYFIDQNLAFQFLREIFEI
jgi:hypothetical protein